MTDLLPDLLHGPDPDPATMAALHARLVAEASHRDLLDVAFTTLDSPVGPLLVAATAEGLVRVAFEAEGHDRVLDDLGRLVSPRVLRAPARLGAVTRELDEYFAGRRHDFDVAVDLRLATGFRRRVLTHLRDVAYGSTSSYSSLAAASGSPGAVRAVGTACATNPVPVVVPCHRVVRSDGSIGQYRGGPAAKRVLLDLERVV